MNHSTKTPFLMMTVTMRDPAGLAKGKVPKSENKAWPQYFAVLAASLAMFCSGIHYGWPSPSLPKILSSQYPFNVTLEEASYITIIGPIGDVTGNIISSLLVDYIGRKWTIMLIGVPQIISMLMIYLSTYSKILLYTARFIGGISEGACFTIIPIYICEVTEPKIRGFLGATFSFNQILGVLFVYIVGDYFTIYTSSLIFLCCSLLFLAAFSCMPESPYYLIMKDRIEGARLSLRKLRDRQNIEAELSSLIFDVGRQMSERGRFKDLISIRSNKVALLVMITLALLEQFSGSGSFTFYAQLLFEETTNAVPQDLAAILMIMVQAVFTLASVLIVDKVGRRPLVLISVGGCCLTLFFNAGFFSIRDSSLTDVSHLTLLPLIGLILFMMFFALGLGTVMNLMMGEVFPANVKAKAACIINLVTACSTLFCAKFYEYTADNYSLAIPFWLFAVCQLIGVIVCYRYVPETKNKSLEQIQQELKDNQKHT